ncbi:tail protein [Synechococcus phage Syn5]|uniref:Tail tube A n=1 Tax=Synechococcus phage Syn5 TaxID=2914003 RepID=A4ZRC1_9CAUD|nr:tail protein [Synechococcus phage Syn5]ABP87947.1 tail tube A [Synechococcus phage Syn5]
MASKLTKLGAVNIVLTNIGMAPVTLIDSNNPMVATAQTILDEVSGSVQSEGWSYNTERAYPFIKDNTGRIAIPSNVLSLDCASTSKYDLIIRGGFLYDKAGHTDVFTENLELDVVWCFEFDDLPEAVKNYITIRAANLFAGRAVGSAEAVKYSQREEAAARAAIIEYETQQGDYNMLESESGRDIYTYRPFDAVYRF